MEVLYSPETRQSPDRLTLLQEASQRLAESVSPQWSQLLKAEWSCVQDLKGRTLYRLTLRDDSGEVYTDFTPDELPNALHMRFRLPRLWGDLLKIRNDQQHQQVQMLVAEMLSGQGAAD